MGKPVGLFTDESRNPVTKNDHSLKRFHLFYICDRITKCTRHSTSELRREVPGSGARETQARKPRPSKRAGRFESERCLFIV